MYEWEMFSISMINVSMLFYEWVEWWNYVKYLENI